MLTFFYNFLSKTIYLGVEARRGRGRGRTKSRVQIGMPITGKYRDPESDQYYNSNDVGLLPQRIKYFTDWTQILTGRENHTGLAL
jgi:hypothetical protein